MLHVYILFYSYAYISTKTVIEGYGKSFFSIIVNALNKDQALIQVISEKVQHVESAQYCEWALIY